MNHPKTAAEINLARVERQITSLEAEMYCHEQSDNRYHISGLHQKHATELNRLITLRDQIQRSINESEKSLGGNR